MGNCVGGSNVEENVFKVTNINDNKHLVQRGLMEVTTVELIYTDSKSKEDWHWPLKYLRKYGCDGDVFTFEAGRKCPGGEGLYAFSTKKASVLFEMVARNINQGNLQPPGEMSPFSEPQLNDSSVLNFPSRRSTTGSPARDQPAYTNIDPMGNPLENGNHDNKPDSPDTVTNNKFVYREVIFDKPPEDHPKPASDAQQIPSYTKIDFDRTEKYLNDRRSGAITSTSSISSPHGRTSSTSLSVGGSNKQSRNRVHTYSGSRNRHVSRSESSFSSQSSLTESSRDVRSLPKANGGVPHVSVSDPSNPASTTYQNVHVGMSPEQQYQNVHIGVGNVNQVFESGSNNSTPQPQQQPNYCNVSLSAGGSVVGNGNGIDRIRAQSTSMTVINEDVMATYAQLELEGGKKKRSMSSSTAHRDSTQTSYMELDFKKGEGSGVPQPNEGGIHQPGKRSSSMSSVVPSVGITNHRNTGRVSPVGIPEEKPIHPSSGAAGGSISDETRVTYGVLDFPSMKALSELSSQREKEREKEQELREKEQKEKEKTHQGKKKKL